MGEGSCWRSLTQRLHPRYRCISLDMLGFGESSKPQIRYDIAKQVAFVRRFVETLNLGSVAIVGHSLGGWVASAYALAYESSVGALVLAAPAGIRDDSFCGRYDALRPLLWQTPLVDGMLWLARPLASIVGQREGLERLSWFRQELNAQPAARSFLVDRLRPEDAIDTVEKEIYRLQVPTLVMTGDRDETIPLWHSQTYASEISGSEIVVIPGADHALPQGYAPEMAELILPFLNRAFTALPHQPSP
ncbi:MAG: alpha/beta hydrolase [Leptolyngbyaceae cyanobacterium SM1_4_3]|nr:alpha/beta hydrolase [Leptolyngbyaceae cyanobacterium SM1_4_3]